jgi:hypothetical protein
MGETTLPNVTEFFVTPPVSQFTQFPSYPDRTKGVHFTGKMTLPNVTESTFPSLT